MTSRLYKRILEVTQKIKRGEEIKNVSKKIVPIKWDEANKKYLITHTIQEAAIKWPNHKRESLLKKQAELRKAAGIKIPKIIPNSKRIGKAPSPYKPKLLIYDIETSYLIGKTWGLYDQNIIGGYKGLLADYQILSVAWCWYDPQKPLEKQRVFVKGQDDFEAYKAGINNDTEVVKFIHALFTEAQWVIAHNGDSFDQRKVRARFVQRKLPAIPWPNEIDTKKMAKKIGGFTSNRLGDLAVQLDVPFKKGDAGGIATWDGCLAGDPTAWNKMKKYNRQDIPPLIGIYEIFRAWYPNHPSVNLLLEKPDACPKCGSLNVVRQGKRTYKKTTTYQTYKCKDCLGWFQERAAEKRTKEAQMKYVS